VVQETLVPTRPVGARSERWIGAALLLHFAYVFGVINLVRQAPVEVFWLSHTSLLLAGLGLVTQSRRLVATVFTAVAVPHALWLVDSISGLVFHWFPLGATAYILTADTWTRIATAHHFYLAPLLFVIVWRHGAYSRACLPGASLLLVLLTVASRTLGSPEINVNYAFRVEIMGQDPLITWLNSLDAIPYLVVGNVLVTILMFMPVFVLMQYHNQRRKQQEQSGVTLISAASNSP